MKKNSLFLFLLLSMFSYKSFAAAHFTLESPAFKLNTMIPNQYTCSGTDISPPLTWHDVPPNTQSLALVVEDPDAPNGVFTHWFLYNIQPSVMKLDAGSPVPEGAANIKNSWGSLKYRGPCPPMGTHRYVFKLYALDNVLSLNVIATTDEALKAMTGHVLGSSELVGLYQKF